MERPENKIRGRRRKPAPHGDASSAVVESGAPAAMFRTAAVVRMSRSSFGKLWSGSRRGAETLQHVRARSENNPEYRGKRKTVEDGRVAWSVPWDDYDPPEFTAKVVLENGRQLDTGAKWADPPDAQELRAELDTRLTYEQDGKIIFGADGTPINPRGRTGLRGRGLLGQWGANHAADPIVTRREPLTGTMQVRCGTTEQDLCPPCSHRFS